MIPSFPNAFAPFIRDLLDDINRLIGPIYLVGEAPLCGIQGKPLPNTLEILVARPLNDCRKRLLRGNHPEVILGNKHNSLLLPIKGWTHPKVVDIATFKSRPNHPSTLEEDLLHRDVTVNAMAYTWPNGPLIDPFKGRQDLLTGEIRLVNDEITLQSNPLRALIFFRFAMQINRPVNSDDMNLVLKTSLESVLPDLIRTEMDRILSLPLANEESQNLLRLLFSSPIGMTVLPQLTALKFPENNPTLEASWKQILDATLSITSPADEEEISLLDLRWTILLGGISLLKLTTPDYMEKNLAQVNKQLEYFQFSKRRARRILALLRNLSSTTTPSDRQLKRFLQDQIPLEGVFRLIQAIIITSPNVSEAQRDKEEIRFQEIRDRCHQLRQAEQRISPNDLALSGGDILDLVRLKPGPWLKDLQTSLVDWVTKNPSCNQRAELKAKIHEWILKQREI